LLHLHGLPQLPDPLCGPRDRQAQILRPLQSGCCHHQSGGCSPFLRRQLREVLEDLWRASGSLPQGTAGPPSAPDGHPQRCRPHSVAVRRTGPPEEGREDRQAALWRLLHHQPGLRRSVWVREVYDRQEPHRCRCQTLCPERDAAHERQVHRVEEGREHGLLPLRHPAGIHHLQVCQVPAEAVRHRARHHR
jgi:Oxygen-sensitive ribonucleoside-triphosphate reductase